MTFTEALSAIFNDGDRVTRPIWRTGAHVGLDNDRLCINGYLDDRGTWVNDGHYRPWTISEQDYFANDWEIVDD